MIQFLQRRRAPSSVLGLALDGNRLEGAWLRRSNGSLRLQKAFAATLALNPLTGDPELVGREIRNHLDLGRFLTARYKSKAAIAARCRC